VLILNIDTSIDLAYISIAKNGEVLAEEINTDQKSNASTIHVCIKALCEKTEVSLSDFNAVAVTIGPGSYTGLRVGLATAKGICYALNVPLITIGTLELMASYAINELKDNTFLYCPMIDARRMEVFTAIFDSNEKLLEDPHALILTENSFSNFLNTHKVCFFGNGMAKWKNICTNENAVYHEIKDYNKMINVISKDKYLSNQFSSVHLVEPLYVKEFYTA
jgi:tRNA threonylcarbamoyladenosine biosynthesis protein TsaB